MPCPQSRSAGLLPFPDPRLFVPRLMIGYPEHSRAIRTRAIPKKRTSGAREITKQTQFLITAIDTAAYATVWRCGGRFGEGPGESRRAGAVSRPAAFRRAPLWFSSIGCRGDPSKRGGFWPRRAEAERRRSAYLFFDPAFGSQRRAEMTPVLKPKMARLPKKRPCSTFMHWSMTTWRPASRALFAAS